MSHSNELSISDTADATLAKCNGTLEFNSLTTLYQYKDSETMDIMQYLFSGRYDRCTLCQSHQRYE